MARQMAARRARPSSSIFQCSWVTSMASPWKKAAGLLMARSPSCFWKMGRKESGTESAMSITLASRAL